MQWTRTMSELMIAGFSDVHRAAQVLHELRQLGRDDLTDLDHAITIAMQDDGRVQVQQTVDPSDADSVTWSAMWSAFIGEAMLTPDSNSMPAAASAASGIAVAPISRGWWTNEVGIPREFIRDVRALIEPGDSALFMLVRSRSPTAVATRLRRAGGTVLRYPLESDQIARLRDVLDAATLLGQPDAKGETT
jgi:uncharacterized membrane protein